MKTGLVPASEEHSLEERHTHTGEQSPAQGTRRTKEGGFSCIRGRRENQESCLEEVTFIQFPELTCFPPRWWELGKERSSQQVEVPVLKQAGVKWLELKGHHEGGRPGHQVLAQCVTWASYLTFRNLNFLICRMGIITPALWSCLNLKWDHVYTLPDPVLFHLPC